MVTPPCVHCVISLAYWCRGLFVTYMNSGLVMTLSRDQSIPCVNKDLYPYSGMVQC
jgi:hypothetical protein